MSRLIGIVVIYIMMFAGWLTAGLFLLISPVRAGNLIHESFGLFDRVKRTDRVKTIALRLAGFALLAFAGRFLIWVVQLFRNN